MYILVCLWIVGCATVSPYFFDGCAFVYEIDTFLWAYSNNSCGNAMVTFDFVYGTSIEVAVITLDMTTFFAICVRTKKLAKLRNGEKELRQLRKNISFYLQGCIISGFYVVMIFSFFHLSKFAKTKWTAFAATTGFWLVAQGISGAAIFAFNGSFRKTLSCYRSKEGETSKKCPTTVAWHPK
ncbi:hypothetical protein Y032_0478g2198 [Ancylostoma ceylanicum]|nr:hypothetical protein Y032_0478g2198 [Ancylostoma ceylanicum]